MTHVVVLTTAFSETEAKTLANQIVEERLGACVQISSPITAVYRWKGEIYNEPEWQLWIKTTAAQAEVLTDWIQEHHSGDLPEVIVLPITRGLPDYLDWITKETD